MIDTADVFTPTRSLLKPMPPSSAIAEKPKNILLVEDNYAHAALIEHCFDSQFLSSTIYHVADGREALDFLYQQGAYAEKSQSPRPHLILLDLRLPKVNGLDVLQKLKSDEALSPIPVVILTTSESETDIEAAFARNANAYVVKPSDFDQFKRLIDELKSFWLTWNRIPAKYSGASSIP